MSRVTAWLTALLLVGTCAPAVGAPSQLGEVAFANSCAQAAQPSFQAAMALLHDFEYADAADAFRDAEKADPDCVMAYWGRAMTFNHPVWMDQDLDAARAALAPLGSTPQARIARAKTPREAAYLHAAETLFGPGTKPDRDDLYAEEMATLHQTYPDDVDATAFYALALLGTSHNGRDIPTYMKAAAVLEEVFPTHPHHPGVLHYMIHSYDDPAHAPLGMRAARLYGTIAANAPHAVHMTSHIFIALGMWDEVIAANDAAIRAVDAKEPKAPPYACGHYPEWLVYGLLQERRFVQARAAIALCGTRAEAKLAHRPQPAFPDHSAVISHAGMLARESIETGAWHQDQALPLDDGAYVEARFDYAYAQAMTAQADPARLHQAAATLRTTLALLRTKPASEDPGDDQQQLRYWTIMAGQAAALEQAADGQIQPAIAALREAAQQETAIPVEFGPPAVLKPPFELLGDLLLKSGDPRQAAVAYRSALVRAPGRTLSLQGLLAAQRAEGNATEAAATSVNLAKYLHPG